MKYYLFCFIMLIICTLSCRNNDKTETQERNNSQEPTQSVGNSASKIVVLNAENKQVLVSLEWENSESIIRYNDETLVGQVKKNDKSKYSNQKGDIVCEVKYKDDGFKLRSADGKLLWKIKLKPDKIKIYAQEENDQNPYEIKMKDDDHLKVIMKNSELGKVKFKPTKTTFESNMGNWVINQKLKPSLALGVLTIKEMPAEHRFIIATELLSAGL